MRPPTPARAKQAKPTGAEAARGAAGCMANLVGVAAAWLVVGQLADAAWAGYHGGDPAHPARRAADQGLALLNGVGDRPDYYLPRILGLVAAVFVLNAVLTRLVSQPASPARPPDAKRKPPRQGQRTSPRAGAAPNQIPTRAGAAVEKAHGGAHATGRRGSREDAVLGTLRYASADGGWWARQDGEAFPIRLEADEDGPSTAQLDLARSIAQRSFEAQLRAAEAARTLAQARGIGLPRFTIASASIGADAGASTPVTLHLRCEGDAQHQYTVRSTNALHSFSLA